jgi:hypothetical protein
VRLWDLLYLLAPSLLPGAIGVAILRHKYDAEQILANFADTVCNETDLTRLSAGLITTVQETMQPALVSLWLRQEGERDK